MCRQCVKWDWLQTTHTRSCGQTTAATHHRLSYTPLHTHWHEHTHDSSGTVCLTPHSVHCTGKHNTHTVVMWFISVTQWNKSVCVVFSADTCDCCEGLMYGPGLKLIKCVHHMFGLQFVPIMFYCCSPACHMTHSTSSSSSWRLISSFLIHIFIDINHISTQTTINTVRRIQMYFSLLWNKINKNTLWWILACVIMSNTVVSCTSLFHKTECVIDMVL